MLPVWPHLFDRLSYRRLFLCRAEQTLAESKRVAETQLRRPTSCLPYLLQVGKSYRRSLIFVGIKVATYYTRPIAAASFFTTVRWCASDLLARLYSPPL